MFASVSYLSSILGLNPTILVFGRLGFFYIHEQVISNLLAVSVSARESAAIIAKFPRSQIL